ncbi:MAG: hypothetical protein KDD04_00370 [Sinomicrobium sp.]|nr:hypothetical protein [Sinomicrobium sp.]
MFSKANLLATLVGFLLLFLLGWVFYGMLAASFFEAHTTNNVMREAPDLVMIAIGSVIQAFMLSHIYSKWARGFHGFKHGFGFGASVGIFMGFGIGLVMYGANDLSDLTATIADAVWSIVYYGIVGVGISMVFGAVDKKQGE